MSSTPRVSPRLSLLALPALVGALALSIPAHQERASAAGSGGYTLGPALMGSGASQPNADPNATLTMDVSSEIATGDPQVLNGLDEISISTKVFAPLLALNQKDQVVANVATSMNVSADGKTYTFKLRKTNYTDGKPVTAADYAYAIARACDPAVGGLYSNILYSIVGCQAWREADLKKTSKAKLQQLEKTVDNSIKALDPRTLQIKLSAPAGYFPYVMTTWVTLPSRRDLVEKGGQNWWKSPQYYIGNGPYKLVKHTANQEWMFTRNDDYFLGKPGVKTLTFKEVNNTQTQFLAYRQGQFDVLGLDSTLLPQVMSDATLKKQLVRTVLANTDWMDFNDAAPPFNNVKVRQAFSYAMDRQRYINQIDNGVGTPAGQLLYPGIAGYQTEVNQTYNPQKAKQLLAQAGYANGKGFPTLAFRYANTDPASKARATFWTQMFKQVLNVNLQPTPTDPAQLENLEFTRDPSLKIYFGDWYEDYPHPQDWLTLVFANGSTRAPQGWNDAHFNALVNRADKLPLNQATSLYVQAEKYLTEKAPVAFYLHGEGLTLIKPNLRGYVKYPTDPIDTQWQVQKIYKVK